MGHCQKTKTLAPKQREQEGGGIRKAVNKTKGKPMFSVNDFFSLFFFFFFPFFFVSLNINKLKKKF